MRAQHTLAHTLVRARPRARTHKHTHTHARARVHRRLNNVCLWLGSKATKPSHHRQPFSSGHRTARKWALLCTSRNKSPTKTDPAPLSSNLVLKAHAAISRSLSLSPSLSLSLSHDSWNTLQSGLFPQFAIYGIRCIWTERKASDSEDHDVPELFRWFFSPFLFIRLLPTSNESRQREREVVSHN